MYDDVAVEGSDGGGSDLTFSWMVLVVNFNGIGNRGESSSSSSSVVGCWGDAKLDSAMAAEVAVESRRSEPATDIN